MSVALKNYQDLEAWKKSMDLVEAVYKTTTLFPGEETFWLKIQLRRAVISIPSNIAEGSGRNHSKEFLQFLFVARGSLREVETQLLISQRLGYLSGDTLHSLGNQSEELSRIISGLINSLQRKMLSPATNHSPLATRHSPHSSGN
jgi:four helix bundle protein